MINRIDQIILTFLQRTIELLAFYLILSNIHGYELKVSFTRLFATKQKRLYGNMILLVVYPLAITWINYTTLEYWLLIDHLGRTLVAWLLLRRIFSLRKTLFTYLSSMTVGFVISLFALVFALDTTFFFLSVLAIIMAMSHQCYFDNVYAYLAKRSKLFNVVCVVSAILYVIPFLVDEFTWGIILLFTPLFPIGIFIYFNQKNKLALSDTLEQLQDATADEFIKLLQQLASKQTQNPVIHQYVIKSYHIKHISPVLSKRLDFYRRLGDIKDYEYIISKRQIKINIIL